MNSGMWENPAVKRNMVSLRNDGRRFVEPGEGELACGDTGPGRMAEPEEIVEALEASLAPLVLSGVRVLVTAGRTEEAIDEVRYISNRSSGRMGFALARRAKEMGAEVTLIHGPVDVQPPEVDSVTRVVSAGDMGKAVTRAFPRSDVLIMAAAVSDFRPSRKRSGKMERGGEKLSLNLEPTTDILASLGERKREDQIVVGFALEADDAEKRAREKIRRKGCDYLVLNRIGKKTGFGVTTNRVVLYKGTRKILDTGIVPKEEAASIILGKISSDRRIGA